MNGMKNIIIMEVLKKEITKQGIDVLFVTETFLSAQKQIELRKVFGEYDVYFRSRKEKEGKKYLERGGVMCIARKGTVKLERECRSDDLMFVMCKGMVLCCAYFVPSTSPFEKFNEARMIELQERILQCRKEVMIFTDSNA